MAYVAPAEFVTRMVDAGESKLLMSTRDTLIRAYMAGAILALAAAFAVTVTVNTGNPLGAKDGFHGALSVVGSYNDLSKDLGPRVARVGTGAGDDGSHPDREHRGRERGDDQPPRAGRDGRHGGAVSHAQRPHADDDEGHGEQEVQRHHVGIEVGEDRDAADHAADHRMRHRRAHFRTLAPAECERRKADQRDRIAEQIRRQRAARLPHGLRPGGNLRTLDAGEVATPHTQVKRSRHAVTRWRHRLSS